MTKLPCFFLSHGGGPWPYIEEMRQQFRLTEAGLTQLPQQLPFTPSAILVVTAHWEERDFTVSTATHPSTLYDYSGFPEHTYHIHYPAPGSPVLAKQAKILLETAGIICKTDASRGFDHGAFVPLVLMYPDANIPVVLLSICSSYDPLAHIQAGKALAPLREQGVLIIGSGLNYHNMRGFGRPQSLAQSEIFEDYLYEAISHPNANQRIHQLLHWKTAPAAQLNHPREDHLIPLMTAVGAAENDSGKRLWMDEVFGVRMVSYGFGI
jgi:aromatic ring-opening dioxygenase catalytic subunit (LigB family)